MESTQTFSEQLLPQSNIQYFLPETETQFSDWLEKLWEKNLKACHICTYSSLIDRVEFNICMYLPVPQWAELE